MKQLYIDEVIKAVNGELIGEDILSRIIFDVSTNSRNDLDGKLFIALIGENFDAHNYIESAYEKGAVCCISQKKLETSHPYIKVADTKQALMDLAEYYLSLFDVKVVALTGSCGKTTTKELIANVLSEKYNVLKTQGNFNNEIGLPQTVFNVNESHEVCVLEMGMNHFGEIHNLSKIAKPDVCVITNIGVSHIEYLGSQEGILKAKSEIFDYMKPDGKIILNGEDSYLLSLKNKKDGIIYFGLDCGNDYFSKDVNYEDLKNTSFTVCKNKTKDKVDINLNSTGEHMILNSLCAFAVGEHMGLSHNEIKNGIEKFKNSDMRQEIIETKKYTIINDAYNANTESMKAALNVLKKVKTGKVAIIGDMLELGEFAPKFHYEIGEFAADGGIDVIVCIGEESHNTYLGASENLKNKNQKNENVILKYFKTKEEFIKEISNILNLNDTILLKASRGMHFEKITDKLRLED